MIFRMRIGLFLAAALIAALPVSAGFVSAARAADAQAYSVFGTLLLDESSAPADSGMAGGPGDTLRSPESFYLHHRFLRTATDVLLANYVQWAFCRYIREGGTLAEFRISWESIAENLKAGLEWDDNHFSTNSFNHPYAGSLYFTSARANGYDYWESIPWAFAGSWHWEYMCEANHGAFNDWINTSIGGVALGESLFRLSTMVLDNTATGNGRVMRELGGFLLTPMRGFNRLVTGEAFDVHANPPDRYPAYGGMRLDVGARVLGDERLWTSSSAKIFFRFAAVHGDPFREEMNRPFDHFNFVFHVNHDNKPHSIAQITSVGYLFGNEVSRTERAQHILAAYQHSDYLDNEAFTYGAQSFGASFLSRFLTERGFETRTEFHTNAIILGASKCDYFSISGREYDYGPGVGYKFNASFGRGGREYFSVGHAGAYIYSINGNDAQHFLNTTYLRASVPIRDYFVFGSEYVVYLADRRYAAYDDVHTRNPELRAYVSWILDK
jgi:hypothetical protein